LTSKPNIHDITGVTLTILEIIGREAGNVVGALSIYIAFSYS